MRKSMTGGWHIISSLDVYHFYENVDKSVCSYAFVYFTLTLKYPVILCIVKCSGDNIILMESICKICMQQQHRDVRRNFCPARKDFLIAPFWGTTLNRNLRQPVFKFFREIHAQPYNSCAFSFRCINAFVQKEPMFGSGIGQHRRGEKPTLIISLKAVV